MRKVSRQEANMLDGWTYVLETNSYFTVEGPPEFYTPEQARQANAK